MQLHEIEHSVRIARERQEFEKAMVTAECIIEQICESFDANDYPGDAFLQGSFEGCEPYEEVGAFRDRRDWRALDAEMLDAHAAALSFFSEAGFRFFLPAYLIADVREALQAADPLFHLIGGFSVTSIEMPVQSGVLVRRTGGTTPLNPRRYGAITFADYTRFRLSVFSREEAQAIVAYLQYRREIDGHGIDQPRIDAALTAFWLDRAENAPSRQDLEQYLREENQFLAHILGNDQNET